jgi:hypothetical protein
LATLAGHGRLVFDRFSGQCTKRVARIPWAGRTRPLAPPTEARSVPPSWPRSPTTVNP